MTPDETRQATVLIWINTPVAMDDRLRDVTFR